MESRSRDIGRKTGLPGLSASALNSIENAEQKPTLDTLLALSTLYGISPGQLFAWIEEERGADEPQPHAGAATASADPAEEPESILQMARSLRESGNLRVAAALLEGLPGMSGLPAGCALLAEADLLAAEVAVDRAEEALQRGDAPRARHHAEQAARVALRARPVLGSLGRSEDARRAALLLAVARGIAEGPREGIALLDAEIQRGRQGAAAAHAARAYLERGRLRARSGDARGGEDDLRKAGRIATRAGEFVTAFRVAFHLAMTPDGPPLPLEMESARALRGCAPGHLREARLLDRMDAGPPVPRRHRAGGGAAGSS